MLCRREIETQSEQCHENKFSSEKEFNSSSAPVTLCHSDFNGMNTDSQIKFKKRKRSRAGHQGLNACNPSYSGSRDQEDCNSKPARANSSYPEKTDHKYRAGGVAQGEGLEGEREWEEGEE
jgi:hypothetical protein